MIVVYILLFIVLGAVGAAGVYLYIQDKRMKDLFGENGRLKGLERKTQLMFHDVTEFANLRMELSQTLKPFKELFPEEGLQPKEIVAWIQDMKDDERVQLLLDRGPKLIKRLDDIDLEAWIDKLEELIEKLGPQEGEFKMDLEVPPESLNLIAIEGPAAGPRVRRPKR